MMIEQRAVMFSARLLSFIISLVFLLPIAHGSIDGDGFGYIATTDVSQV